MIPIKNHQDDRLHAMQQIIRKLRRDDLNEGHCFMIFDEELPDGQAYYEYPDGRIQIEQVDTDNFDSPRLIIKKLTDQEIISVKEKHEVFK